MRYHVRHQTTYVYSDPVVVSLNQACVSPRETPRQRVLRHTLKTTPATKARTAWSDAFGNMHVQFQVGELHREMVVLAESDVDVDPFPEIDPSASVSWEMAVQAVCEHTTPDTIAASQFRFASPLIRLNGSFRAYAEPSFTPERPLLEALLDFTARIRREFTYDGNATNLQTPVEDVLERKRGVCQDFAQVQIAALRSLGLAARYVSGYLLTKPPPGKPRLIGADASHCWTSVFIPGLGWVDVDPTNGCLVSDEHVTAAWGRDYHDVTPVKGVILGGGQQSVRVAVDVLPADEVVDR